MITYIETPPRIDILDNESRSRCEKLLSSLSDTGVVTQCDNGFNLFSLPDTSLVLIRNGIFKYFCGKRLVRLYLTHDMFLTGTISGTECRCVSEFGAAIQIIRPDELLTRAAGAPGILKLFIELSALQSEIQHILATLTSPEEVSPDFNFQQYPAGSIILHEGDPAQEIYMLVSGKATVTVQDVEVGTVHPGEVFGEISFFTKGTRSATVKAEGECLVQVMNRDDFLSLVKIRPSMNIAITRTLSERLIDTNRRIAGTS